jgi:hypothetical protein
MTYVTGDIPVGAYDSTRLANIGIGHGAIDGGGGYTYFNPQTGHEFCSRGLRLQFRQSGDQLPERRRLSSGHGGSAVFVQAGIRWRRWLCLRSGFGRPRVRSHSWSDRVARLRRRATGRIPLSGRKHAGGAELEGLLRVRQSRSALGLEHMAHIRDLASRAACGSPAAIAVADDLQMRRRITWVALLYDDVVPPKST